MFKFVQDGAPVNNFVLFHDLFFDFVAVLTIVRRVNNILQFCIIVDLKSADFLFVDPNVDRLYLFNEICCHILIAQTAIRHLVTRNLQKHEIAINAVIFNIYASFHI